MCHYLCNGTLPVCLLDEYPQKNALMKEADKYIIRFPEGMRQKIAEAAKANNRSMNAEIIDRLQKSFSPPQQALPVEWDMDTFAAKLIEKFFERVANK